MYPGKLDWISSPLALVCTLSREIFACLSEAKDFQSWKKYW